MVGRFADRRADLRLEMALGASGVLMGPVDRRVHRHHPIDHLRIGAESLQRGQDRRPHFVSCPARNRP
jgi:hypothetical protein